MCKYYATIYKDLNTHKFWYLPGDSGTNPHGYQEMTIYKILKEAWRVIFRPLPKALNIRNY